MNGAAGAATATLRAEGVTVEFPAGGARRRRMVHAVDDVSIDLWPGEVTAVVGESGSGKSTLARALCRLVAPKSGRLWLDGAEVPFATRRGARTYRRDVQLILQDPFSSLNPVHSIGYHLGRPLRIHDRGGPSIDEAVDALLERVKLAPAARFRDRLPHELSGGQLQRVAIARALAVGPRVLLADEPVSMLDVSIRLGVLNLLDELCAQDRLAVLYVTHDIASARYLASTVAVMYAGRIVETGPAASVVDNPAHPYTQLLLAAAPDPDRQSSSQPVRTGAPPSLIDPPSGCRFHPRCPFASRRCAEEVPPDVEVGAGQRASCWNLGTVAVGGGVAR